MYLVQTHQSRDDKFHQFYPVLLSSILFVVLHAKVSFFLKAKAFKNVMGMYNSQIYNGFFCVDK